MSRRPQGPDRAAANQQAIKTLLRQEGNKSCADCKRNKHPRWASWNLGVFVCIRCSGIHRGMGTHISRVKSVDLDAWTDEQLQSVTRWGNARANRYWEDKLAAGHVPSEPKIENFIRTKYESRRWVMDGPMPDPASLTDDDNVPLTQVQERVRRQAPADLLGVSSTPPNPPQSSTATVANDKPKADPVKPKQPDSLLGLDFGARSVSSQPAKPDFKQSILSLYAKAPPALDSLASSDARSQPVSNGLDELASLAITSNGGSKNSAKLDGQDKTSSIDLLNAGTFFDAPSTSSVVPNERKVEPATKVETKSAPTKVDLFALEEPTNSPFMLTKTKPTPAPAQPKPVDFGAFSNSEAWGSSDAWSSSEPTPAVVAPKAAPVAPAVSAPVPMADDFSAWASSEAQPVPPSTTHDDFGGWSSAAPEPPKAAEPSKSAGGFAGEDLFSNVWE